jgi:hypothetical protein
MIKISNRLKFSTISYDYFSNQGSELTAVVLNSVFIFILYTNFKSLRSL